MKKKPPRLWLRAIRKGSSHYWVIRDGGRQVATGCRAEEREAAERKFAEYLIAGHLNERDVEHPSPRGRLMNLIGRDLIGEIEQLQARVTALERELQANTGAIAVQRLGEFIGNKKELNCQNGIKND
jgi:hypothetical protein